MVEDSAIARTASLVLQPRQSEVDFRFNAVRLSDPAQLQFRCRLDGYDSDWTVTSSRHMLYRRLPPGHYRFVVGVREQDGAWSPGTASVDVEHLPFTYQRWWFQALLATAFVGVIALLVRWRFTLVKDRIALVVEERNRIAREWHDTLMADFAAIAWQLEATRNRLDDAPARVAESLELTRTMVKHCQSEARRIIWDLRQSVESVGLLSQELTKELGTLGARTDLATIIEIEGEERAFAPVSVHHLVCIAQEAVSNASRHAEARTVRIKIVYGDRRIRMSILDDGRGFEQPATPLAVPGHFGLSMMSERAKRIGGAVRIHSRPGEGTEVVVEAPLREVD